MKDRSNERTETEERVAENQTPAPRVSITKNVSDADPVTGLPRGMHDDDRSPLDRGSVLDPARGRRAR